MGACRTVEPASKNGADLGKVLWLLPARKTDVLDFRPDLANIVPGMGWTVATVRFEEGADGKASVVFLNFGAARNAIAAFFADGVHEIVESLLVGVFVEVFDLLGPDRVALLVESSILLELLSAFVVIEIVDGLAVFEVAVRKERL